MDQIARLYAEVSADATKFNRTMGMVDSTLHSSGSKFSNFTQGIIQGFGQAFGQATIQGIKNVGNALSSMIGGAASTEQQVADIQSILQATDEEGQKIKDTLNSLAVNDKLKVSLTEAGQLTEMLARNGVAVDDIIGGMAKSTILLSNATKGDFSQSADVLTDVMALWKDLGLTQENAVNSITSVTNKSKLNLNEYQYAIANVAGSASNLKIPFEDVNAALIATASYFKSGRTQGTSFDAFLTRLVPTTKAAQEAFDKLGISGKLFDETGTLKGFDEIAGLLQNAISGLSDESAIELLSAAFGRTSADFLLGISKVGTEGFNAIKEEAAKVNAEVNAGIVTNTTLARWETFKDKLVGLGNVIGDKFLPDLKRLINGMIDLTNISGMDISGMFDGLQKSFQIFVDYLLANQGNILKVIQNVITGITNFASSIPSLISWLVSAKNTFSVFVESIRSFFSSTEGVISQFANSVSTKLQPFIDSFKKAFDNLVNSDYSKKLQEALTSVWSSLSDNSLNFETLGNSLKGLGSVLLEGLNIAFEFAKESFNTFYAWLTSESTISMFKKGMMNTWNFFSEWAGAIWSSTKPKLEETYINLIAWITDSKTRQQAYDKLVKTWDFFTEWGSKVWGNVTEKLSEFWTSLISWVSDSSKQSEALNKINSVWTWFKDWALSIWSTMQVPLFNMWLNFQTFIDEKVPSLKSWTNSITDFTTDALAQFKLRFPEMSKAVENLGSTVKRELPLIGQAFSDLWGVLFGDSSGNNSGKGFADVLSNFFVNFTDELSETVVALRNLLELLADFGEAAKAVFSGDMTGFSSFWDSFTNKMAEMNQSMEQQRNEAKQWLNDLTGINLFPSSMGISPEDTENIIASGATSTLVIRVEDANNLPQNRTVIEQLAQALQQELNLSGVRVSV